MARYNGLIIPRSYNDYFSRSDPQAIRDLVSLAADGELNAESKNPLQNQAIAKIVPATASPENKLIVQSQISGLTADVETIKNIIPNTASETNELADKNFVNSTVGTNTANYIYKTESGGEKVPFSSVAELEAYAGTVTNNDYAFVTGMDENGNAYYDRYKANVNDGVVTWAKEYRLNNSSFTAEQWAAINSGITAEKLESLVALGTPDAALDTSSTNVIQNAPVAKAVNSIDDRIQNIILKSSAYNIDTSPKISLNNVNAPYNLVHGRTQLDVTFLGYAYKTTAPTESIATYPQLGVYNDTGDPRLTYLPIVIKRAGKLYLLPPHKISSGRFSTGYYYWLDKYTTLKLLYLAGQTIYKSDDTTLVSNQNCLLVKEDTVVVEYNSDAVNYKIMASGLIEQWGKSSSESGKETINLPVTLSTTDYDVHVEVNEQSTSTALANGQFWQTILVNFTKSNFDMIKAYHNNGTGNSNSSVPRRWSVKSY